MSIWRFFSLQKEDSEGGSAAETETVRKIVKALDLLAPERARFLAAFAYILSRVAHADLDISEEETRKMEGIVTELGSLPVEQAVVVVQMAKTQSLLFGETENFLVTREFNKLATREQKIRLLECLFAVSSSDESISTRENSEIRLIARELLLDHKDLVAVRSSYREHLAVLKKPKGTAL